MRSRELRREAYEANMQLLDLGLVVGTFGNASAMDREAGLMAIKPSGVSYGDLSPGAMVLVDLEYCVVEGALRPSSDTRTHIMLYRFFDEIRGVAHTHSPHATSWAQGRRDLECLGTTHADYFHGGVPVTDIIGDGEIESDYEGETGRLIADTLSARGVDYHSMPGILVASHGPFTWGMSAREAVFHSQMLEYVAYLNTLSLEVNPGAEGVKQPLLDKHYLRKHGADSYYGQSESGASASR